MLRGWNLYLFFEGKPDFGTCRFPLLELCVNGHIFTHAVCYVPHSAIWQLVSHPPSEANANGYLTREVWRASIHSLSLSHTHTKPYKQSNSGSYWSKSLSWSLVIIVDAVSPACPSCKYFLGVTHVPTAALSPAWLICPPLLSLLGCLPLWHISHF